jgi:hypothetical protein
MTLSFRLPSEIPLEEYPHPSAFIDEGTELAKKAQEDGIMLRIMGGLAVFLHSQESRQLWESLDRLGQKVFTDIDFASYGRFRNNVFGFFKKCGYSTDQRILAYHGMKRQIYFGQKIPMIDVFFDELDMNHVISFKGRLEADYPTIPLAELLLEKLQIVRINEKDVKDVIVLLRGHKIADEDVDSISHKHISKILSNDWGFYHTVTENLRKIEGSLRNFSVLNEVDISDINGKIAKLVQAIEERPKSMKWKMRARAGTKKMWYQEVQDWT